MVDIEPSSYACIHCNMTFSLFILLLLLIITSNVHATLKRGSNQTDHENYHRRERGHHGHRPQPILHHINHPDTPTLAPTTALPTTPAPPSTTPGPTSNSSTPTPPTAYPTTPAPTPTPSSAPTTPAPTNPVSYGVSFVLMPVPTLYFIFYGNFTYLSPGTVGIVDQWARGLNGSAQQNIMSTYYGHEYYSHTGTIVNGTNLMNYGGYYLNESYPYGKTDFSDYDMLLDIFKAGIFSYNIQGVYMFIVAPDVIFEGYACGGGGNTCAYHSWNSYAAPYNTYEGYTTVAMVGSTGFCGGCETPSSPNNNLNADSIINVAWHEWIESITDPLGDYGWTINVGSAGDEIADKCEWQFGSTFQTPGGQTANVQFPDGNYYVMQQIWLGPRGGSLGYCTTHYP